MGRTRTSHASALALTVALIAISVVTGRAVVAQVPRDGASGATAGRGELSGVVVSDDAAAKPVRRATVSLRNIDGGGTRLFVTDDAGGFAFRGLPAGHFLLSVTKLAFVTSAYGALSSRGPGQPIALTDGQRLSNITMRIARGAVVTGRIVDDAGRPIANARVEVSERVMVNGVPTAVRSNAPPTANDETGTYRVYGLAAGTYIVAASITDPFGLTGPGVAPTPAEVQWALRPSAATPGSPAPASPAPPRGQPMKGVPVYYPGTTDQSAATLITLAAGEERSGIDLSPVFVPTATLSGTVVRTDGQPVRGSQIVAFSTASGTGVSTLISGIPARAVIAPDGRFSIGGLAPGHYMVTVRAPSAAAAMPAPGGRGAPPVMDLWALAELEVNGRDVSTVSLALAPGMMVAGRIVFESTTATSPADLTAAAVRLTPPPTTAVGLGVNPGQTRADGAFAIPGVAPGSYLLTATLGTGGAAVWFLKSAIVNGRNVLDDPFEVRPGSDITDAVVTFTDRVSQVSGKLTDQAGQPAGGFFVIVFPVDSTQWRQQSRWMRPPVRPGTNGTFTIASLPPGDYYLAALSEFNQQEWFTPAFLQQIVPSALKFTLGEGEKKVQDLRLR